MTTITVELQIQPELKAEAEEVLNDIGLSTAEAIRLFLQQVVNVGGLPFQPMIKQPNATTLAALNEADAGGGERFTSTADLFASWEEDDA